MALPIKINNLYDFANMDFKRAINSNSSRLKELQVKRDKALETWAKTGEEPKVSQKEAEELALREMVELSKAEGYDGQKYRLGYEFESLTDDERRQIIDEEWGNEKVQNGGKGSGNYDHAGRPGEIGGSAPEGTKKGDFNDYRFRGFKIEHSSNKYDRIRGRINSTKDKVIVRYDPDQCFETPYGYGLRLNENKGIWLKPWQVSDTWDESLGAFVREIVLDKNFCKVVDFKENPDYQNDDYHFDNVFDDFIKIAKEQSEEPVRWKKKSDWGKRWR